jgi:Protein of unknown function (DUF3606)
MKPGTAGFSSMLQEKRRGDDKTKTCGPDRDRINVHEIYKVRNWAKKLGVTPNEHKGLELFRSQAPGKRIDRKQSDLQ